MQVSEMISAMGTLGIGEVYSDVKTKETYLLFLNLAHDQLYRETANLNDKLSMKDTLTTVANQSYVTLTKEPFFISKAYMVGRVTPLPGLSVDDFDQYVSENVYSGNPEVYNNIGKVVNVYPITTDALYTFNIRYVPVRSKLEDNTLEEDIPYPVEYHGVLVDGALYYLFQDEGGFKNTIKENEAKKRWEKGKIDLTSYLKGRNQKRMSTYENV